MGWPDAAIQRAPRECRLSGTFAETAFTRW
jgi:hypothetical protein